MEAVVALQVLEKSAEVNLKAEVIGGAKFLPADEAEEMRRMYLEKYSRREQESEKDRRKVILWMRERSGKS